MSDSLVMDELMRPPNTLCDACGRKGWDNVRERCRMAQPDGSECPGLFFEIPGPATNQTQEAVADSQKEATSPVGDSDLIGRCAEAILFRGEPGVWDDAEPSDRNESLLDARFAVAAVVPLVRADRDREIREAIDLFEKKVELDADVDPWDAGYLSALADFRAALACIGTEGESK